MHKNSSFQLKSGNIFGFFEENGLKAMNEDHK